MREIEFRAKSKEKNEWVYGYLVKGETENCYICKNLGHAFVWVDEATIGQYTGLKDKNGTKIFEGDIIKIHFTYQTLSGETLGVYEDDKEAKGVVSLTPLGFYIDTKDEYQNYIWEYLSDLSLLEYPEQIEVIGNIYDEVENGK